MAVETAVSSFFSHFSARALQYRFWSRPRLEWVKRVNVSLFGEGVNREKAKYLQPQIWTYSGVLINYSSLMSVPSGEKQGWGKQGRTYVSSTNHAVWDEPRVIPWLSTVRDHFWLDITYQIILAAIDVEGSPETKVVDAIERDET